MIRNAAQAVASIAKQDIPLGEWTDLMDILVTNAGNTNMNYKQGSIMTLGYICEGITQEHIG